MKIFGITRRIDELGRVVIPKEIRKKLNIKFGDLFEIYINDNESIILKKYSQLNDNIKVIDHYIKVLSKRIKSQIIITDLQKIILSSDNKFINNEVLLDLDKLYKEQKFLEEFKINNNYSIKSPFKIYPINPNGDLIGYVIFNLSKDANNELIDFSYEYINKYFEEN